MSFQFKKIIEHYCNNGNIADSEIDFLEIEHIKTISTISEILAPSIADLHICKACNLDEGSFLITCNASILDRIRPVKAGKSRAHKLFDALCKYNLLTSKI